MVVRSVRIFLRFFVVMSLPECLREYLTNRLA